MRPKIYTEIIDDIKEKIKNGFYKPLQILPSENKLSINYEVSRMTIRRALSVLITEGYIQSSPGKGNFVTKRNINSYYLNFDELNCIKSEIEEAKLIEVDIIMPTIELVYNLQIPQDDYVVSIKRILFANDSPVIYDEKFIPYYSGIPIVENEIETATFSDMVSKKTSIFTLRKELIIKMQIANEEISKMLNLNIGDGVFVIEQKVLDEVNQSIGWGKMYFKIDEFNLNASSILKRNDI